jgi:prephenate dehydrogenase
MKIKIKQSSEKFEKVVLIGVGVMGGSLTRDLLHRKLTRHVVGMDRSKQALRSGLKVGAITHVEKNISTALQGADLVIVATPVLATQEIFKEIAPHVGCKTLVIDLGSTKKNLVTLSGSFFPQGNFVGCHPMAGTEKSGVTESRLGLFCGKICFLVPGKMTSRFFLRQAQKLWQNLSAQVLFLSAGEHDHQLAYTSHLPHIAAYVLVKSVAGAVSQKCFQTQVGGGFKDTTRVAASHARMWRDIFLDNQKEVLAAMTCFETEWKKLKMALQKGQPDAIETYIAQAAQFRRRVM